MTDLVVKDPERDALLQKLYDEANSAKEAREVNGRFVHQSAPGMFRTSLLTRPTLCF